MTQKGRGIFMVYVDIDAQHVQEFNKWYNEEHLPELLSVPGILSAARYSLVLGKPSGNCRAAPCGDSAPARRPSKRQISRS